MMKHVPAAYELSMQGGNYDAIEALGNLYLKGKIVKAHADEGLTLLKAAYFLDPYSRCHIGDIYNEGRYVDRNPRNAVRFYVESMIAGNNEAIP